MISVSTLKKHKLDADSLKALFTADEPSEKIKSLKKLISDRNRDGITRCLTNHRTCAAIDLAYDAPFHQETPTIIKHILDTCHKPADILKACQSWNVCTDDLFCKTGQKDSQGNEVLELNPPVFHEVRVPVVRSYTTVRTAKIFNDRNLSPLLKYDPAVYTSENRIRCEILTNAIERISSTFGYPALLRQMILQSNMYSEAIMFPMEPWYEEKQEGEEGKEITVRAGVRYITPHKTRTYIDQEYPASTLNTDTGCEFAGYWSVSKWGNVQASDLYWNKDKVTHNQNWLDTQATWANYFQQAYPCVLEFPTTSAASKETNRETIANRYTDTDYDKAVFLGYQFARLKPKQWGLGDYNHPVWFRFIIAGDDQIVWAEPFCYRPTVVSLYDTDQTRGKNASLAQEIIPSQDLLGNLITQVLLSIKRNLANVIFFDSHQISVNEVSRLQRRTQWQYQQMNFLPFDSYKDRLSQNDKRSAFHEVKFAYADISQQLAALNTIISLLERLLVVSPQEIGSAASHQQSKAEVVIIAGNTTNRVAYTAGFVDEMIEAWKTQLYEALHAHGPDEVIAEVSADIPELEKHLKALGFEVTAKTENGKKVVVKGKKDALKMEAFVGRRTGPERNRDAQVVQAMYQAIASINQNQQLAAIADPQSILELLEQAAKLNGADEDFHIRVNKEGLKANQLQALIQEIQTMIMQQVEEQVAKPAAAAIEEQSQVNQAQTQELAQINETVARLSQIVEAAMQAPPAPPVEAQAPLLPELPQPPAPPIAPPNEVVSNAPAPAAEELPVGMA